MSGEPFQPTVIIHLLFNTQHNLLFLNKSHHKNMLQKTKQKVTEQENMLQ